MPTAELLYFAIQCEIFTYRIAVSFVLGQQN